MSLSLNGGLAAAVTGPASSSRCDGPASPARAACHAVPSPHILVVDDEAGVRALTSQILARQGYATLEAQSGEEGLLRFLEAPEAVRLVILDLGLPGMDGEECLARLRQVNPAVRVIVVSGRQDEGLRPRLLAAGACAFLTKPFGIHELVEQVAAVLAR